MLITVVNATRGRIPDAELQSAIRAVNRQLEEDFAPAWGFGATLRLVGAPRARLRQVDLRDMRGDAILYVYDEICAREADGYHATWFRGVPYGVVFVALADLLKEDWRVTLSHEALELVADPETNLLVQARGPHHRRMVYYWYEVCDPVQNESYRIDGECVSNFVLPAYFTAGEELGGRNDFLGTRTGRGTLRSFGVNPGGYLTYYDPHTRKTCDWMVPEDAVAARRLRLKARAGAGRRMRRRAQGRA